MGEIAGLSWSFKPPNESWEAFLFFLGQAVDTLATRPPAPRVIRKEVLLD